MMKVKTLVFVLVGMTFAAGNVQAIVAGPTIAVGDGVGLAGADVTVPMAWDPGAGSFKGVEFRVGFDPALLTFKACALNPPYAGYELNACQLNASGADVDVGLIDSLSSPGPVPAGELGTLTFTISPSAAPGEIPLTVNTIVLPGSPVAAAVDGAITVGSTIARFATSISFSNGYDGSVDVRLTCNNGIPLQQDYAISAAQGVEFVTTEIDVLGDDTRCEITLASLDDGYVAAMSANGNAQTADSCVFQNDTVDTTDADFDAPGDNSCVIQAEPVPSVFLVYKEWLGAEDPVISRQHSIAISCSPAATDTGSGYTTVSAVVGGDGDGDYALNFYPSTAGTTCTAVEDTASLDAAVEPSSGCPDGVEFRIGDATGSCRIVNTVFYEGIPALGRSGLVLLALLMLGVGFIGMRRIT